MERQREGWCRVAEGAEKWQLSPLCKPVLVQIDYTLHSVRTEIAWRALITEGVDSKNGVQKTTWKLEQIIVIIPICRVKAFIRNPHKLYVLVPYQLSNHRVQYKHGLDVCINTSWMASSFTAYCHSPTDRPRHAEQTKPNYYSTTLNNNYNVMIYNRTHVMFNIPKCFFIIIYYHFTNSNASHNYMAEYNYNRQTTFQHCRWREEY